MGTSLNDSLRRVRIDNVKHNGYSCDKRLPTKILKNSWELYLVPNPPSNSSITTRKELIEIMSLRRELVPSLADVRRQNTPNIEVEFIDLLIRLNIQVSDAVRCHINDISNELNIIVNYYKNMFKRPRPLQLFYLLGKRYNNVIESEFTDSPSYPSNIATKSRFFDLFLGKLYPDVNKEIHTLSGNICFNRIVAGAHYPSDIDAGRELADRLFKAYSK